MRRNNYAKKRKLTKLFITFAVVGGVAYGASLYFGDRQSSNNVVVAKINNQKIYQSEIDSKIREVFSGSAEDNIQLPSIETFPPEVIETFAKEVYLEKQLVARAKKAGVTKDQALKQQIKNSKNRIISNAYLNHVINEEVSAEKISEKYSELNSSLIGKKEFLVAHIVVKDKSKAEKIYDKLTSKKSKNRSKFADLAKQYSIDKDTANNGGKLGYVLEDNMVKEIAEVTTKLKKDEISQPVETKSGWHVIKVEDIRDAKSVDFEDVKDSIKEQMIKEATGAIYKDIFDNVKIEILLKKADEVAAPQNQDEVKQEEKTDESKETKDKQELSIESEESIEVEVDSSKK